MLQTVIKEAYMSFREVNYPNEVQRLYNLYLKYKEDVSEIYTNQDKYIHEYLYGKSTPIHRGFYNPTIAAHLAIGGNHKGPKPKTEKITENEYTMYGIDEKGRPIFIRTYLSDIHPVRVYEVVFYLEETILGISMDQDKLFAVHESKFTEEKLKEITFCQFGILGNPDYYNCTSIEIEMYDYDSPNHFNWKLLEFSFSLNFESLSEEMRNLYEYMLPEMDHHKEIKYSFDLDDKGKIIRMYNDYHEKIFKKKKLTK
jgi:hypothetical protein